MRIAIVGLGGPGGGLGRLFARAGHEVLFTGSRSPDKLTAAATAVGHGARAAELTEAVAAADVIVMAVPFVRYADAAGKVGVVWNGKGAVDTSNPIAIRGERVRFRNGASDSASVSDVVGLLG